MANAKENPYRPEPINEYKLFACRDKQIQVVKEYLDYCKYENPSFYNFLILGNEGSGKTSMLNMIKVLAKDKKIMIVNVPLFDVESPISFLKQLFDSIMTAGADEDLFGGKYGRFINNLGKCWTMLILNLKLISLLTSLMCILQANKEMILIYLRLHS
jgi:energy-coupling factor transporter ATP-binding protein EcfA2